MGFRLKSSVYLPGPRMLLALFRTPVSNWLTILIRFLVQLRASIFAPILGRWFTRRYPNDFLYSVCPACERESFKLAYTGGKPLPNPLYAGAPPFPKGTHGKFPLMYWECQNCGAGRINPVPAQRWVDFQLPNVAGAGQADWMENQAYIQDKQLSLGVHYRKLDLNRFRGGKKEGGAVLDVSCGSGVGLAFLGDQLKWKDLYGVECDPMAVQFAREKRKLKVELGFVYDAQLPEEYFDLVILDNALEHHFSPKRALSQLRKVLKKSGGLAIIVPNFHGYSVELCGLDYCNMNWGHWNYFTVASLRDLLSHTGFKLVQAYSAHCEDIAVAKLGQPLPSDIEVELNEAQVNQLPHFEKRLRGDYITLLAVPV